MQKISTMQTNGRNIFGGPLTIGLDPGDRSSASCVRFEQQNERRVSAIFFRIDPQVRPSFSEGGGFVVEGLG
jgi:hypothetical protein